MDKAEQVITKFKKDDKEMITTCFDEYYFVIPEGVIRPSVSRMETYNIGDTVPVKGETYSFPEDFNIIDLHGKKVAKVRMSKLNDIEDIDDFEYDSIPAYNIKGFWINIFSSKDFDDFKSDFNNFAVAERLKLAAFANKWFDITRGKNIRYQ